MAKFRGLEMKLMERILQYNWAGAPFEVCITIGFELSFSL